LAPSDSSLVSLRVSVHSSSALAVLTGVSPKLTTLALTHARLDADALSELPRLLAPGKPCGHVQELDLTFAYIGDAGAIALAAILAVGHGGVGSADLARSRAQEKDLTSPRPLSPRVPSTPRAPTSPRLPGTASKSSPRWAHASDGRTRVGLHKLVLAHCAIYAPGGLALVRALESNRTLATLDLSSNPLGDQFARALAALLASSNSDPLSSVVVTRTFIADAGVALLSDAVRANRSITSLGDLSDLPALIAPRRLLELAVEQNASLARRLAAGPEAAREEAVALLPAEQTVLRAEMLALRGELRQAHLATDDVTADLQQELEKAAGEAEQANVLLDATIKRNKQLRDRCSALELELAANARHSDAHVRTVPELPVAPTQPGQSALRGRLANGRNAKTSSETARGPPKTNPSQLRVR
jgi:hypothetical protein